MESKTGEPIQVDRIHFLERHEKILVMDRQTGGWVMFARDLKELLPLVGADPSFINNPKIATKVEEIEDILRKHRIGVGDRFENSDLNTVIIKLTKACNLACSYCYDYESEEKATHLNSEVALRTIYEAIDICQNEIDFIFHGGEPMLVWDMIEDLVRKGHEYALLKGVKVNFLGQTNLTRIDDEKVNFSNKYNLSWGVSLDGMRTINDQYRVRHNQEGSYDTIMEKINQFPEFISQINAMSTITNYNQDYLLEIAEHIRALGFAGWDWSLFQPIGRGRQQTRFDINPDRIKKAWDRLFDGIVEGKFFGFVILPVLKYINNFLDGPASNMCMRAKCGAARDLLSVSYDGTIEACDCIDSKGDLANLGHMNQHTLSEALNSEKAKYVRSRDIEKLQCGSCMWQAVCGGTCMAKAGGIDNISKSECALSMHAFDRISQSISQKDVLIRYKRDCE